MVASPIISFTIIRHAESTDNLRNVLAGWADAGLSNHGMNQAKALGASLAKIRFTAIHSSTLKRAVMTAQAVLEAQLAPQPPLITSTLLREQHFGIAEGKPWSLFPVSPDRIRHFPEGETREDVERRAEQFIQEILLPYILQAARDGTTGAHVAIVSHGIFISELVAALVRKGSQNEKSLNSYRGMVNTGWMRVSVGPKATNVPMRECPEQDPPTLVVRVTDFNRQQHLDGIKRQKGGIGSAAYDRKQKDIRSFFGGGDTATEPHTH